MQEAVRDHVHEFMSAIEPNAGLTRVGELVVRAVTHDPRARAGFEAMKTWLGGEVVDEDSLDLYRRLRGTHSGTDPLGGPDGTSTVLAVAHAQARAKLRAAPGEMTYNVVRNRLRTVNEFVTGLDNRFVGDLLVETETKRRYDHEFDQAIGAETARVKKSLAEIQRITPLLATPRLQCRINNQDAPCGLVILMIVVITVVRKVD